MSEHHDDHDHEHEAESYASLRTKALESLLVEKGTSPRTQSTRW